MTRVPFINLPTGCPDLHFDINIMPPNFTLCEVPTVAIPTTPPLVDDHDIVVPLPPAYCPCIPALSFDKCNFDLVLNTGKAGLHYNMAMDNDDCCAPEFDINFSMVIPCMPLDVHSTGNVQIAGKTGFGTIRMDKRIDTCVIDLNYHLDIPCLPLGVHSSGNVYVAGQAGFGNIGLQKRVDTCVLDLNYNLNIPCLPLGVLSTGTIRMTGKKVTGDITLIKDGGACAFNLVYDLNVPCMPISIEPEVSIKIGNTLSATFDITRPPCTKITYGPEYATMHSRVDIYERLEPWKGVLTYPTGNIIRYPEGTVITGYHSYQFVTYQTYRVPDPTCITECAFDYNLDINIPCMPLAMNANASLTIINDNAGAPGDSRIKFNITRPAGITQFYGSGDAITYITVSRLPKNQFNWRVWVTHPDGIIRAEDQTYRYVTHRTCKIPDPTCIPPCEFNYELDIKIPCLPLEFSSTGTVCLTGENVTGSIDITRQPDTCVFDLNYNLNIPCMPLGVSSTGTMRMGKQGTSNLEFNVTRNAASTCEIDYSMDICIPCMHLMLEATGAVKMGEPLKASFWFSELNTCILQAEAIRLHYDIQIPTIKKGYTDITHWISGASGMLSGMSGMLSGLASRVDAMTGLNQDVPVIDLITWYNGCLYRRYMIQRYEGGRLIAIVPSPTLYTVFCGESCTATPVS